MGITGFINHIESNEPSTPMAFGVTGGTGAGKTFMCEKIGKLQWCSAIFPGKKIREMISPSEDMATMAPIRTEKMVRDIIESEVATLANNPKTKMLFIDGVPRSMGQLMFFKMVCERHGITPSICFIHAPIELRKERVAKRNDKWDEVMAEKRFRSEEFELDTLCEDMSYVFGIHKYHIYNC